MEGGEEEENDKDDEDVETLNRDFVLFQRKLGFRIAFLLKSNRKDRLIDNGERCLLVSSD